MSVVAEFTVHSEVFGLHRALSAAPEMSVEAERIVTHSREWVMPFLWARGERFERFEAGLSDDETVREFGVADEFEDARLYRVHWAEPTQQLVDAILDREGTLLEARGQDGDWQLKIRLADHEALSQLERHFEAEGKSFTLRRVQRFTEEKPEFSQLSPQQREALVAALEAGYYDVPRNATTTELAEELGVSQQAISERLRRGTNNLISETLLEGETS